MAFMDIFTGDSKKQAAADTRAYLDKLRSEGNVDIADALEKSLGYSQGGFNQARSDVLSNQGAGRDAIYNGFDTARGNIGQGFDSATGNINNAYGNANAALTGAYNTGRGDVGGSADRSLGFLDQGQSGALGRLDAAGAGFDALGGLGQKYGAGSTLYLDALGVNGADGQGRARDAFKTTDAYNFNLDQGLEAINRRRNAGGMLASGNADRDAQTYGAGLASNEYDKWLGGLQSLINPELQATSGAATGRAGLASNAANVIGTTGQNKAQVEQSRGNMLANLAQAYGTGSAGLAQSQGRDLSTLDTQRGGMLADLASRGGQAIANNYAQSGGLLSNLGMQQGSQSAQLTMDALAKKLGLATSQQGQYGQTYKNAADAETAASGNAWNGIMQGIKLAASAAGGGMGGMGGGSMFGGGNTGSQFFGNGSQSSMGGGAGGGWWA